MTARPSGQSADLIAVQVKLSWRQLTAFAALSAHYLNTLPVRVICLNCTVFTLPISVNPLLTQYKCLNGSFLFIHSFIYLNNLLCGMLGILPLLICRKIINEKEKQDFVLVKLLLLRGIIELFKSEPQSEILASVSGL